MKRVEKIIAADSNATRNMLAFKLSVLGGMRVGEVAALTVGQVRGLDGSFRHFAITNRVQSGLQLQEVAKMTGTSLKQVEETYWHLNEEQMRRTAMADFVRDKNGTIIPTM